LPPPLELSDAAPPSDFYFVQWQPRGLHTRGMSCQYNIPDTCPHIFRRSQVTLTQSSRVHSNVILHRVSTHHCTVDRVNQLFRVAINSERRTFAAELRTSVYPIPKRKQRSASFTSLQLGHCVSTVIPSAIQNVDDYLTTSSEAA